MRDFSLMATCTSVPIVATFLEALPLRSIESRVPFRGHRAHSMGRHSPAQAEDCQGRGAPREPGTWENVDSVSCGRPGSACPSPEPLFSAWRSDAWAPNKLPP